MSEVIENRIVFAFRPAPHHRQPLTGRDYLGADKNPCKKAIQFFEQHHLFAKGKKLLFKVIETLRRVRHESSIRSAIVSLVPIVNIIPLA
jgi:hypothetical protein